MQKWPQWKKNWCKSSTTKSHQSLEKTIRRWKMCFFPDEESTTAKTTTKLTIEGGVYPPMVFATAPRPSPSSGNQGYGSCWYGTVQWLCTELAKLSWTGLREWLELAALAELARKVRTGHSSQFHSPVQDTPASPVVRSQSGTRLRNRLVRTNISYGFKFQWLQGVQICADEHFQ